jgi:integrase/recombinase XerC
MSVMLTDQTENVALALSDSGLAICNAVGLWAEATTRTEVYDRKDKLKDKIQVVTGFYAFTKKHPVDVTPADVIMWRSHLEAQGQMQATVYARVSRVSSFYKWLMADPQLGARIKFNPAAPARPRCPRPYQSDSVKDLTDVEMNSLLEAIKRLADSGSFVAKRDYALLLLYFLTGMRRNEVSSLRGTDVELNEAGMIIKYRRKGGKYMKRAVDDPTVREALLDYLNASGRGNVLGSERPLWTRHDRAGKPGAPLTSRSFAENLKAYAGKVGIEQINVHKTRHTFARIVAEETGSYLETQEALDHENAATTRIYVERITVKADKHSQHISRRFKVKAS